MVLFSATGLICERSYTFLPCCIVQEILSCFSGASTGGLKCYLDTLCYRSSINTRGNDIAESVCFASHKANDYKGKIFLMGPISVVRWSDG